MSLPAARAGRHTVAAQASALPGLRSSTPYQRSGAPGLPSGGRAAGHKQPRFTRGVKRHARRAGPAPACPGQTGGIPLRHRLLPDMGGLRRRQSVRYRGRHRLPRALFCQAPFSAPGHPAVLRGAGPPGISSRDVLAVLNAMPEACRSRARVSGADGAVAIPGSGKGHARLDNSAGPFS